MAMPTEPVQGGYSCSLWCLVGRIAIHIQATCSVTLNRS